jgi:hypothetical protein
MAGPPCTGAVRAAARLRRVCDLKSRVLFLCNIGEIVAAQYRFLSFKLCSEHVLADPRLMSRTGTMV